MKKINLKKGHWIGLIASLIIVVVSIVLLLIDFFDIKLFYFVLGIAFIIGFFPFFIDLILSLGKEKEKDEKFLDFARDLVEGVRSGTPISKSIMNIREKDYGILSPHIMKLANQIALGIPVKNSMETFAADVNSKTITRSVSMITEAEKAGGKIEDILESIAGSVEQIEKLKKERRAAIATLVVQGYIIFFIFIAIMLVMQFKIIPITQGADLGGGGGLGGLGVGFGGMSQASGETLSPEEMATPFLYLLIVQGFFAGLIIGKISEGSIKSGLKHSFVLGVTAILVSTGASLFI